MHFEHSLTTKSACGGKRVTASGKFENLFINNHNITSYQIIIQLNFDQRKQKPIKRFANNF